MRKAHKERVYFIIIVKAFVLLIKQSRHWDFIFNNVHAGCLLVSLAEIECMLNTSMVHS